MRGILLFVLIGLSVGQGYAQVASVLTSGTSSGGRVHGASEESVVRQAGVAAITWGTGGGMGSADGGQAAGGGRWHDQKRVLHYRPEGGDFTLVNGGRRFNRALYGTNTAFRVETGDLPEFALYMPGMGGNLKFGLIAGNKSKWIIGAERIRTRYRPGSMLYEIRDPLLGNGVIHLTVLALAETEGMVVKASCENIPSGVQLCWAFGGATGLPFKRDGDIGVDPESSFYLQPEYCRDDTFVLSKNSFVLQYGTGRLAPESERYEIQYKPVKRTDTGGTSRQRLMGTFPAGAVLRLADAGKQGSPLDLLGSKAGAMPVVMGRMEVGVRKRGLYGGSGGGGAGHTSGALYFLIENPNSSMEDRTAGRVNQGPVSYTDVPGLYQRAEKARENLAGRVVVNTPDPYINTLGGALSVAADAIWEDPSYLHGAIAWRQRFNGWRGAYIADPLGWHDRARQHFSSYAKSQVLTPATGPVVADTALNMARQLEKLGTSLFSEGYISRYPDGNIIAHHYDMNLVFIDQLLTHFYWTGDLSYVKEMWPLLKRHLAWEKRNFDGDGDGLYDAYCCIWASDALQYSGGGVTHSSAYNYRANQLAAKLAVLAGEDPTPYREEAVRILSAIRDKLWMPAAGHYAEYEDQLGLRLLHPAAGLWTIYTALDEGVADPFSAYQSTRYVDRDIPHIPVRAEGLPDEGYYTLSTTNWQPYTWSLNNVALAETLHTSLAYWQAGRSDDAYRLWKSALVESLYLSASPGGFEQLSYYDAMRGELYRDFADPIGMAGRTLVEGLFGIHPNALEGVLTIRPGLPAGWDHASLKIPDLSFQFQRKADTDNYVLAPSFSRLMGLRLQVQARAAGIRSVTVNGRAVGWKAMDGMVGAPMMEVDAEPADRYVVRVVWEGKAPETAIVNRVYSDDDTILANFKTAKILDVADPQKALWGCKTGAGNLMAFPNARYGSKTVFIKLSQGAFSWWQPFCFEVGRHVDISAAANGNGWVINLKNNSFPVGGKLIAGEGGSAYTKEISLPARAVTGVMVPGSCFVTGSNRVRFVYTGGASGKTNTPSTGAVHRPEAGMIDNWGGNAAPDTKWETVDLSGAFNDQVMNIFKQRYLSPRSPFPTLQLPVNGIGNWVHLKIQANIDDGGLRRLAGNRNEIRLPQGIPFATPGRAGDKNILFTSQWDNYPDSAVVALTGRAGHVYLLMAGSTNPMQSRMTNGVIYIKYRDGSEDSLELKNPENWWPIEEDYYSDGYAFTTDAPKPYRLYLKTGEITRDYHRFITIEGDQDKKGITNYGIDGGAATVLDLPLDGSKELKELTLKALANDVVIGLMGLTLER